MSDNNMTYNSVNTVIVPAGLHPALNSEIIGLAYE
jgi:hypothetical protein